jgi:DNA-binding transcriptional regulator YiaG
MSTAKFREVRARHLADPQFRAAVAREKALMARLDIAAARLSSGMTQEEVAAEMGRSQENVSRIERQHDVRISTLIELIRAQGGELEITAVFPDRRVSLLRPVSAAVTR